MTEKELFEKVCISRGFISPYVKSTVEPLFDDALEYLRSCGVDEKVVLSNASIGVIGSLILAMRNDTTGDFRISSSLKHRITQLIIKKGEETDE